MAVKLAILALPILFYNKPQIIEPINQLIIIYIDPLEHVDMRGSNDGALSVRVQSCTGKTVQLEFLPKVLGGEVLEICKRKFKLEKFANFGIQLPSGAWIVKEMDTFS